MRRRSDGWLNATQILKVAGFDKPQRTRVLEREVQKGEHEKVQGGYGKYQGAGCCVVSVAHSSTAVSFRNLGAAGARHLSREAIQRLLRHTAHSRVYTRVQ